MRESAENRKPLTRRRALELLGAGVLVGAGAVLATVRTSGYALPAGRRLAALADWQFIVVEHAARRIAAPDDSVGTVPSPDEVDVAGFVDAWIGHMDTAVRRDLGRFLAYLEHVAPFGAGFLSRFTRLRPLDQDRVLRQLEGSKNGLLRAGFEGLKSLVFMGYYRSPRTWKLIGYDGPLLGRPPGGWR